MTVNSTPRPYPPTDPSEVPEWLKNVPSGHMPRQAPTVFGTVPRPREPRQEWVTGPVAGQAGRRFEVSAKAIVLVVLAVVSGLAMMVLGVAAGKDSPDAHRPDASTLSVLQYAQSHSDAPCYAVWGPHDTSWSVKCGDLR